MSMFGSALREGADIATVRVAQLFEDLGLHPM